MSTQNRELQPNEIKTLIQNQGKTNLGGTEFQLNNPAHNDSNLQAVISAPNFSAKALGTPSSEGVQTYELNGNGQSLKIKVTVGNTQQGGNTHQGR